MVRLGLAIAAAAALAATLSSCATARHDWRAAERARDAERDREARAAIAAADPVVTVEVLDVADAARVLGGRHALRRIDPSWMILRARVETAGDWLADVDAVLWSNGQLLVELRREPEPLTALTDEIWPTGTRHSYLRTADAPWYVHVLTAGVLTVLTLHFEHHTDPPTAQQIADYAPRAVALARAANGEPRAGRSERLFFVRRPLADDLPLEVEVGVSLRRASDGDAIASLSGRVKVPIGGVLAERIGQAVRGLHLAAAPDARRSHSGSEAQLARCYAPGEELCSRTEVKPWPTKEVSSLGLTPPPVPERLGTPRSSFAARPWWGGDAYAPEPAVSRLDDKRPVAATLEGGVAACKLLGVDMPGEDADKVYAVVELDGKKWRVDESPVLPLITLGPKTTIAISFWDRDFWTADDFLVKLKLARHGDELTALYGDRLRPERRGYAEMRCRLFDRDAVEAAYAPQWLAAADLLDDADDGPARVRPDQSDLGEAAGGFVRARQLITEGAGLLGWDDPRVRAQVEHWEALEQRFWAAARASLEGLPKNDAGATVLTEKDGGDGTLLAAAERVCGAPLVAEVKKHGHQYDYDKAWLAHACGVRATLVNRGAREAYWPFDGAIVLSDGRAVPATAIDGVSSIASGATATLLLLPKSTPPPASANAQPWRLWRHSRQRVEIFPVAESAPAAP